MEFDAASDAHVQFSGNTADTLVLGLNSRFTGSVSDMAYGDAIDLVGVDSSNISFVASAGALQLHYEKQAADFFFTFDGGYSSGDFALEGDGSSGTRVVFDHAPDANADNVIASADAFIDPDLLPGGSGITHLSLYIEAGLLLANDSDSDSANLFGSAPELDLNSQNGSHGNFYNVRGSPIYEYTDSADFPSTPGQSFADTFNFNVSDGLLTSTSSVALKVVKYDGVNETLRGTNVNDVIIGADSAPDRIEGGGGDDILVGGFSSNHANADTFIFVPDMGHDKIADFQLSFDKIVLNGFEGASGTSSALQALLQDQSEANFEAWKTADFAAIDSNTVSVALDDGDELTIVGANVPGSLTLLASLQLDDFIIPARFA